MQMGHAIVMHAVNLTMIIKLLSCASLPVYCHQPYGVVFYCTYVSVPISQGTETVAIDRPHQSATIAIYGTYVGLFPAIVQK